MSKNTYGPPQVDGYSVLGVWHIVGMEEAGIRIYIMHDKLTPASPYRVVARGRVYSDKCYMHRILTTRTNYGCAVSAGELYLSKILHDAGMMTSINSVGGWAYKEM